MNMSGSSGRDGNVGNRSSNDRDPVNYHEHNWQVNGNNLTNASIGMIPVGDSTGESFGLPNLGYGDVNVGNAMFKGGVLLPAIPGILPPSLPHLPADSAFIERAARFSCFGRGNLGDMMNSVPVPDPLAPYSRGSGIVQGSSLPDVFGGNESSKMNVPEVSNEAEFSGGCAREELEKGVVCKKRKRGEKDIERDENDDTPQPSMDTGKNATKPSGKNGKSGSDSPKEEYIHVRARRGQATNSHSLAERVRREKISERMKFLQDLVPGCSKVTGKAVMLDEIINYVQSLQRQVEFLSMKLATVNPRVDFNIETFLAKDARTGLSTYPLDMTVPFSPLHPLQPGLIQSGLLGNSSEVLRRPINLHSSGYKEPTSQVPSMWEDELHNVVHMGFNSSAPLNSQDLNGSAPSGHMKAEP